MPRDLATVWTEFADTSCGAYSPLYDRICRVVAGDQRVLDLVGSAPRPGHQPNVLLAAVHDLLLEGLDHPLAAVYSGTSDADPGPLFVDVCLTHTAEIAELLATRHTNTNEVGRSAVIAPALAVVAESLGEPLGLVDVGCSAGLNLHVDRYRLDYGERGTTGPADAAIRIACEVVGGGDPPLRATVPTIASRVGLDRHPIAADDERETRWLLACVWPDTGRLPRTRLALDEARRHPVELVTGDAVESLAAVVAGVSAGVTPVVLTTWALAYLARADRVRFRETLAEISRQRPLAWISGEGPGVVDLFADHVTPSDNEGMQASVLGLAVFDAGDVTARLLGFVHPHGSWIDWRASTAR